MRLRSAVTPLALPKAFALLLIAASAGCEGDWRAETHPASGSISINGEPPVGALVHLDPVGSKVDERNSRPWGKVREDGSYTLTTYERDDGAPAGRYRLTVVWPVDPATPSPEDRLRNRFSEPEQSPWEVSIAEGEHKLPPVEVEDIKVLPGKEAAPTAGPLMPRLTPTAGSPR